MTRKIESAAATKPAAAAAAAAPAAKPVNNGHFKPGSDPRRGQGRPGERPNHLTRDIKRGIVDAAEMHGSDGKGKGGLTGYLLHLARRHPKAFAGLLSKTIPLQVTGAIEQHIRAVNIIAIPSDRYLSQDDINRMTAPALAAPAMTEGTADDTAGPDEKEEK